MRAFRIASLLLAWYAGAVAAVQRPPASAPGPWNNDILVFRALADGRVEALATFPRAGVSTLTRMADGRLVAAHQHFPENNDADFDKVAVRFSGDEGRTWSAAEVIRLSGLVEGFRFPFDPTLVPLPDGRVRLYFTSRRQSTFDLPAIYSAISTNGVDYQVEPGRRFGLDGRPVIDCAVALHRGVFHLFAPDNGPSLPPGPGSPQVGRGPDGAGYHATSQDGLAFTRAADVQIEGHRQWLGAAYSDGTTLTFFGTGEPGARPRGAEPPRGGVWMATSRDGSTWQIGGGLAIGGADPGAVPAREGGWIVSVTGPPRVPRLAFGAAR
jgi:hypothetical protein